MGRDTRVVTFVVTSACGLRLLGVPLAEPGIGERLIGVEQALDKKLYRKIWAAMSKGTRYTWEDGKRFKPPRS